MGHCGDTGPQGHLDGEQGGLPEVVAGAEPAQVPAQTKIYGWWPESRVQETQLRDTDMPKLCKCCKCTPTTSSSFDRGRTSTTSSTWCSTTTSSSIIRRPSPSSTTP